jgi:hypothetical protein
MKKIFIIHGHDSANRLLLEQLLRDRWKFHPVVMKSEPGKSRALIEKLEEVAHDVAFAIALLTPDDIVGTGDEQYAQPRPNVTFELGWFCGHLGRQKVCILVKEGTEIHSDLEGISTIRFRDEITEKVLELELELNEFTKGQTGPTPSSDIENFDKAWREISTRLGYAIGRYERHVAYPEKYSRDYVMAMVNEVRTSRLRLEQACGPKVGTLLKEIGTEWLNDVESFIDVARDVERNIGELAHADRVDMRRRGLDV